MDPQLLATLSEPANLIAIVGTLLTALGIALTVGFYILPRRIHVKAFAKPPLFSFDASKQPFTVQVVNQNTRQVKIEKIGFETFVRGFGYHELTYSAGLLRTEKLLVTESEHTEITFDGNAIARDIAGGVSPRRSSYNSKTFKIWLYLTHGSRVEVKTDPGLSQRIRAAISEAVAAAAGG